MCVNVKNMSQGMEFTQIKVTTFIKKTIHRKETSEMNVIVEVIDSSTLSSVDVSEDFCHVFYRDE